MSGGRPTLSCSASAIISWLVTYPTTPKLTTITQPGPASFKARERYEGSVAQSGTPSPYTAEAPNIHTLRALCSVHVLPVGLVVLRTKPDLPSSWLTYFPCQLPAPHTRNGT